MSDKEFTLGRLFPFKQLSRTRLEAVESTEKMSLIKENMSKEVKGIRWPAAYHEIINTVGDLLDVGVPDILVAAWNKYQILRKYTDRKVYSPNETFIVNLSEHTIKSEHHPYVEILINNKSSGKIDFTITIALTLKGVILKIRDGKIMEILSGSCKGKGVIKCENFVIFEQKTDSFPFPGSIRLGEGVPIPQ